MLFSGKNSKVNYFLRAYLRQLLPNCIFQAQRERLLQSIDNRQDKEYIYERVNYYCKLAQPVALHDAKTLAETKLFSPKVYFFDSQEFTRYFPQEYRWKIIPGDVTEIPVEPAIVKSRPIAQDNANSTLLNLDKIRHFIFLQDTTPFERKSDKAIFRGEVHGKQRRIDFMNKFFGSDVCDCADTAKKITNPQWTQPPIPIFAHFKYKYVICLEGGDVASNLKWVMNSNSIAVMPPPTCETWFMEGTLLPNVHYIAIKPDYSDLEERLQHYSTHPNEALQIIHNAHQFTAQFKNALREKLIALATLNKYFSFTNGK